MADYFMVYNLKYDGWVLIWAWVVIRTNIVFFLVSISLNFKPGKYFSTFDDVLPKSGR